MIKRDNFFILTGAPGVGKTTLLFELAKSFSTVPEPAREVIAQQRGAGGSGLWDKDRILFVDLLLSSSIEKYEGANSNTVTFFDRGIPDNLAYASYGDLSLKSFKEASKKYRYNQKVFLLPPWEEIYATDKERNMHFNEVLTFHKHLLNAYEDYDVIEVPKGNILERVKFLKGFF